MKTVVSEFERELRRNLKGINDFYSNKPNTISPDTEDIGFDGFAYLFAPVIYLVGILEPIVETPTRAVLNRYPI